MTTAVRKSAPAQGRRSSVMNFEELIQALIWSPLLHELSRAIPEKGPEGRPRKYPEAIVLMFGALARHHRSAAAAEAELFNDSAWQIVRHEWDRFQRATVANPADRVSLPSEGICWHHWKHARDTYLVNDTIIEELLKQFTATSIEMALELGYFDLEEGSLSHPSSTRSIYGDGTEVRSAYRCLARQVEVVDEDTGEVSIRLAAVEPSRPDVARAWIETDPVTGEKYALDAKSGKRLARLPLDREALKSNKYGEYQANQNIVTFHTRNDDASHSRMTLAIGMDESENTEADTAMRLLEQLAASPIGPAIQCVVYDKALRGVHLDRILTEFGYIPVVKVAAAPSTKAEKDARRAAGQEDKLKPKNLPLGSREHTLADGSVCKHLIYATNGQLVEMDWDERGALVQMSRLPVRRQVKKQARERGGRNWGWSVEYEVACPKGTFSFWLTPHSAYGEKETRIAENVRIFPEVHETVDPEFRRLAGRRNDSENSHSQYKETLRHKRSHTLGRNGMLLDALLFFAMENSKNWLRQIGWSKSVELQAS